MGLNKKHWNSPQLIILTRVSPEESVLTECKFIGADVAGVNGPNTYFKDGCNENASGNCGTCLNRGSKS